MEFFFGKVCLVVIVCFRFTSLAFETTTDGFSGNGTNLRGNNSNITEDETTGVKQGFDRSIILLGLVSKETYDYVVGIISYAVVPCQILAILFNICIINIFSRKDMETSSQVYLLALSIVELLYCLFASVAGIMALMYGEKSTYTYAYLWYAARISGFITISIRRSAYVLTFVMTLERFVAVAFPLKFRHFKITPYSKTLCCAIVFIGLIFHCPKSFKDIIVSYKTPGSTEIKYRYEEIPFFVTHEQLFDGLALFVSCVYAYIPLFACLLLDIFTILAFKAHSRNHNMFGNSTKSPNMVRRERQMTITLMVSSLIFVIFSLPINVSSLVSLWSTDYRIFKREHYLYFMMFRIGYLSEIISNCTDFIFYFILSTKFRRKFLEVYFCYRHPPTSVSGMSSSKSQQIQEFNSLAGTSSTVTECT
ncbi:hypothetical protein SNE40_015364 [Patella caerulea]|uniref:G-protein coupled receptors family 1 profile domain-containing protein n=1 Tax=Patella caerulea TaxID=87958 RepID=A0AAN8JHR4_PATCE